MGHQEHHARQARREKAGILLLLLFAGLSAAIGQDRKLFPHDTVPRDRLVTTREFFAHLDLTIPSLRPVADALRSADTIRASQLFLDHLRRRSSPQYFFPPSSAPERSRAYRERYADDAAFMKDKAIDFQETYGADVDWRVPGKDLRGRPHTPNTVRSLARHLYAENFAILYHLTGDVGTVRFQMDHLRDFVSDFEAGKAETGGNDVFERFYAGHRIRNLMMFHQLLLASDVLTLDEQMYLVRTFLLHGAKVIDGSRKFNWGNHQLVGLCALYEMTLMYPEFSVMREWNRHVFALILEHMEKEVLPDGFQFERASHYFKLDILNYFRVFRLAEVNGIEMPEWAKERFRKMFHAILAVLLPDGSMPPLQDAQDSYIGNRNLDEARARLRASETSDSAELVDPAEAPFLSLGAYLYRDPQLKYFGSKDLHGAFSWFLDADAPEVYRALGTEPPSFTSVALRESGYYVMRSGWGPTDAYMIIDGELAKFKPDHTHGGALGVIAAAGGRVVLPNYRVRYSDPLFHVFKNSTVKNVALADSLLQGRGWIPNAARTGFGKWAVLAQPTVERWYSTAGLDLFVGTHNGFDSIGVSYRRTIAFLKPDYWVVVDDLSGSSSHRYQQIWQGQYAVVAPDRAVQENGPVRLDILQAGTQRLRAVEGSQSSTGGDVVAHSVGFETSASTGASFVTALVPSTIDAQRKTTVRSAGERGILVRRGDEEDLAVFGNTVVKSPSKTTLEGDALIVRSARKTVRSVYLVGATSMEVSGLTMRSAEKVSMELTRGTDGVWSGIMTEGSPGTLEFSSGSKKLSIAVRPHESFQLKF